MRQFDSSGRTRAAAGALCALAACVAGELRAQSVETVRNRDSSTSPAPRPAQYAGARRTRYFPIAAPFYKPETRVGAAATVTAVTRRLDADSADRPSSANLFAIVTQKGQLESGVSADRWSPGNRHRLQASAGFSRFPLDFYGVGTAAADTVDADSAESYTPRTMSAQVAAHRRVGRALYVGAGYQFQHTALTRREPGGLLDAGGITGSRGGTLSSLTLLGSLDTRDNLYAAARGVYVQLTAGAADGAMGSDFDFTRVTVDARKYMTVRPGRVLAVQAFADAIVSGDAPFDRLPQIGGQNVVRGYYMGKYRDRNAAAVQAEYRAPLWRRLGAVAFAGAGVVMPRWSAFDAGDVKPGYGAGLRYALSKEERVNVRADFGFGQRSSGLYLTLGEAF